MAKQIGISLGKFNYCLKELVKKGFVKIYRFKSSDNKVAYMYILTPKGIEKKAKTTVNFLNHKMNQYERIKQEIEDIKKELMTERTLSKKQKRLFRNCQTESGEKLYLSMRIYE